MSELGATETNTLAVKEHEKMVVLEMPYPSVRVILDPPTALAVANGIAQSAYIAEHGVHPDNSLKTAALDQKHLRMTNRVAIMLGGKGRKSNKLMAKEICDVIFSEIL